LGTEELAQWVPLPGSGDQGCDDNRGINGLDTKCLSLLYDEERVARLTPWDSNALPRAMDVSQDLQLLERMIAHP